MGQVLSESLRLRLFLRDTQKQVLSLLSDPVALNFFRVCEDLGKKEVSDTLFYALTGTKDISEKMLSMLLGRKATEYFGLYCPINAFIFAGRLVRLTHVYILRNLELTMTGNIKSSEITDLEGSIRVFKSFDIETVESLNLYLCRNFSGDRGVYLNVYNILHEKAIE